MGGYIYNRLFCIWKSISAGYLPFGLDHGISLSGMRTYKSRNPAFCIWTSKEHGRCIRLSMHSQQVW